MAFYCQDAFKLVEESLRTKDSTHIPVYRDDCIQMSLQEISYLLKSSKDLIRKELYKHCIHRSKRCILAYQRHRLERFMKLFWDGGANTCTEIPEKSAQGASIHESTFVKEYRNLVTDWKGKFLDIDVGSSVTEPPKDLFLEVRVVRNCGEIMTEMGPVDLTVGTQRFLKRIDVEDLLISGDVIRIN